MPIIPQAVFFNYINYNNQGVYPLDAWIPISGVTPGNTVAGYFQTSTTLLNIPPGTVTSMPCGFAVGSAASACVLALDFSNDVGRFLIAGGALGASATTNGIVVKDLTTSETVTIPGTFFVTTKPTSWSVSQSNDGSVIASCTCLGSGTPIFLARSPVADDNTNVLSSAPTVFQAELYDQPGNLLASAAARLPYDGSAPILDFGVVNISKTDTHYLLVKRTAYNQMTQNFATFELVAPQVIPVSLTAGFTSVLTSTLSYNLNNAWYLTDLQVDLATRSVTHRHGSVEIKPNDTVQFGVFFKLGGRVVDPVATDLRLAVRSANNTSAYYFWANPSVTTTSVSGDIYYTITVTASDEDLLAAQAAGLVAGSNASQTLLAEVQWTTTRGTFTSDTFNITVANEVVREPDV